MFTHLHKKSRFSEDQARVYIGEIVLALERLHQVGWLQLGRGDCYVGGGERREGRGQVMVLQET